MKKLSKNVLLLLCAAIMLAIATTLFLAAPSILFNRFIDAQRKNAKLKIGAVNIPGFEIVYAEGGTGDTVIMLHGFGGSKDNWLDFAKYFTSHYRVIIPDLPGFGESSKPQNAKYDIMSQVERLHLFAKELKLTKFHLVGHSMGGNIAGNYAAAYPGMVTSLALFDSARVIAPIKSEFDLLLEKGINACIVKAVEDLDRFMEITYYNPPQIPSFMKNYLVRQFMKVGAFHEKIFEDEWDNSIFPESRLKRISAPTLIVWGEADKTFHISSVPIFEENIRNSRSVIIKECGHAPMMEKPAETASIYQHFLQGRS